MIPKTASLISLIYKNPKPVKEMNVEHPTLNNVRLRRVILYRQSEARPYSTFDVERSMFAVHLFNRVSLSLYYRRRTLPAAAVFLPGDVLMSVLKAG